MNSLIAFEASARHLSFTRAAQELLISREAVSRQIRILENYVGVKLFARLYRSLELTEAGEEFQSTVRESLENIALTTESLCRVSQPAKVTVTATVAITTFWIMPRLKAFREQFPEIEIRVNVSDTPLNMVTESIDVGLMYGSGSWPGLKSTHLFDVHRYPVCSQNYLKSTPAPKKPADLANCTLMNLEGTQHSQEDWTWWLEKFDQKIQKKGQVVGFDNYANVIQATLAGQGIALGYRGITDELLTSGRLVHVTGQSVPTGQAVYLVVPGNTKPPTSAQIFIDWVIAEIDAKSGAGDKDYMPVEYRLNW